MQGETSHFPYIKNNLNPDTNCPRACPAPSTRLSPRSERTQKFHTFIALGTVDWNLRGSESQRRQKVNLETVGRGASAEPSRVLVASGQRIDVGIMEKCVVTIPPGEGLGSDAEVVVRDELWALLVASVHPAIKGAEGYARESQHKGQDAPGVGWGSKGGVRVDS